MLQQLSALRAQLLEVSSPLAACELVAMTACEAVGAASATVQVLDPRRLCFDTLCNVGRLTRDEVVRPEFERYSFAAFPYAHAALMQGRGYIADLADPGCPPEYAQLLAALDRSSCLGAPIVVDTVVEGELWLSRDDGLAFDHRDLETVQPLATLLGRRLAELTA